MAILLDEAISELSSVEHRVIQEYEEWKQDVVVGAALT